MSPNNMHTTVFIFILKYSKYTKRYNTKDSITTLQLYWILSYCILLQFFKKNIVANLHPHSPHTQISSLCLFPPGGNWDLALNIHLSHVCFLHQQFSNMVSESLCILEIYWRPPNIFMWNVAIRFKSVWNKDSEIL